MRGSRPNLRAAPAAASPCSCESVSKAIPTTVARGNASRAISTRLAASSSWRTKMPVTLPPGMCETRYIPVRQRVEIDGQKRDRPPVRSRERGTQRWLVSDREEHVDLARRELAIIFLIAFDIRCLDVIECKIPAFLIAQFGHPLEEGCIKWELSRLHTDKADTQHLWLLRVRRKRQRSRRTAKKRDELSPSHAEHRASSSAWGRRQQADH